MKFASIWDWTTAKSCRVMIFPSSMSWHKKIWLKHNQVQITHSVRDLVVIYGDKICVNFHFFQNLFFPQIYFFIIEFDPNVFYDQDENFSNLLTYNVLKWRHTRERVKYFVTTCKRDIVSIVQKYFNHAWRQISVDLWNDHKHIF